MLHFKNSNIGKCSCETLADDSYLRGKYLKYLFHWRVIYLFWLNIRVHKSCGPVFAETDIAVSSRNAQETVSREREDKVKGSKKNNIEETEIEEMAWSWKEGMIKSKEKNTASFYLKRIL